MPPKTEKAVAAETKKKNAVEANEIVAMLKRTSQRDNSSTGKCSRAAIAAGIMEPLFDSSKLDTAFITTRKNTQKATTKDSKKKCIDVAKEIVRKQPPREKTAVNGNPKIAKTATITSVDSMGDSIQREHAMAKSDVEVDGSTINSTETCSSAIASGFEVNAPPKKPGKFQNDPAATSSKSLNKVHSAKSGGKKSNAGRAHGTGFQYEIDCKSVADSIDVTDLDTPFVAKVSGVAIKGRWTKEQPRKHYEGQLQRSSGGGKFYGVPSQKGSALFVEKLFKEKLEYTRRFKERSFL